MDAVVGLLDGVRARSAFVLRMMMDPPWSLSIRDDAPLTLFCQTHGSAAIVGESSGTTWLHPGEIALARGTEHYVFADDPATAPMVVIHPGNRCTTRSGETLKFEMSLGVRTWGNSPSGATRSVICAYQGQSEVSSRLLDVLPAVLVVRADEWDTPLVDLLRSSQATIGAVARQVGYSTPFALSSAFKRAYGVSPNTHRANATSSAEELDSSAI